ncbi:MAG: outer membrane beta-barrel protein [Xanthobacteraceae bacterium]
MRGTIPPTCVTQGTHHEKAIDCFRGCAGAVGDFGIRSRSRLPYYKSPPPPPPITWSGCYVDGGIGYGLWNQRHYGETDPGYVAITPTVNTGGEGWLGRLGGGCDYQVTPRFVIGALADYDFTDLRGTFQDTISGLLGTEKETGAWAAGGRVGYPVTPNLLTYFDAGYTQARFSSIALSTNAVPSVGTIFSVSSHTYNGWFLGGGTEYALSGIVPISGLFWRTEYRFADYQAANVPIVPVGITGSAEHMQKDVQTVTSGLVWRFNFGGGGPYGPQ